MIVIRCVAESLLIQSPPSLSQILTYLIFSQKANQEVTGSRLTGYQIQLKLSAMQSNTIQHNIYVIN